MNGVWGENGDGDGGEVKDGAAAEHEGGPGDGGEPFGASVSSGRGEGSGSHRLVKRGLEYEGMDARCIFNNADEAVHRS